MSTQSELDHLTSEIEQGFMQRGGWKACRYLLGKLAGKQDKEIERLQDENERLPVEADRFAYEYATAAMRGAFRSRTRVSDALEDYLQVGSIDGPATVPEWIKQYEARVRDIKSRDTIVTAPAELIEAGQRITKEAAEEKGE